MKKLNNMYIEWKIKAIKHLLRTYILTKKNKELLQKELNLLVK